MQLDARFESAVGAEIDLAAVFIVADPKLASLILVAMLDSLAITGPRKLTLAFVF